MWIDHLATCPRERAPRNPVRKKPELTAICLCALLAASSAAQGANLVWSVEATDIPPLPAVRLWLNCLNPTSTSISWEFAARIEGRLTAEGLETAVRLERIDSSGPSSAAIPPGGFVRRQYQLAIPRGASGQAIVSIPPPQAGQVVLELGPGALTRASTNAQGRAPSIAAASGREKASEQDATDFFQRHLFPHEPFYFVAGTESPNAKFQVSVKYRLFDPEAELGRKAPPIADLYVGYTQTSVWDWNAPSAPFVDNSYKPELLYYRGHILSGGEGHWWTLALQSGLQHESNGRGGADSRSLNIAYLKPTLTLGYRGSFQVSLAPRAWFYVGDLSDNPDIADYRGYADLVAKFGWEDGLMLAATLKGGQDFDHGSLQLDLTYPLKRIPWLGLTCYAHVQYFTGYGETFLHYRESSDSFRVGFSLYR